MTIVQPAEGEYDLTEEQEAEIEASIAEIERGEYVDGDDIIRELKRRSGR
jgi:predicted transcriptional regulator